MLCTGTTDLPVHPVHVLGEPIACHERHAFLQLAQHVFHLMVGIHAHHNLTTLLADCCGECEVTSIHIETLREGEGLVAVDSGT